MKDKRNFLNYAKGSCAELRTQIYIGIEIGYISSRVENGWVRETKDISSMLTGLMKYLKFRHSTFDIRHSAFDIRHTTYDVF